MMRDDFAVFILSHGRPDRIHTLKSLKASGYTGKVYIVIDNEDDQAPEYFKRFGAKVVQFDKLATSKTFDTGDNFKDRRTIVYARNECFEIARRLGLKYFLELDDDYVQFEYRYPVFHKLYNKRVLHIDSIFEAMLQFLETSGAITVAFAQGGDFVGGAASKNVQKKVLRKAMNTFFCSVERAFQWTGRINEDVNTYTTRTMRGDLMLTITDVAIVQKATQHNQGGMTDVYLDSGTYLKSFYTVMYAPSCTTVATMGGNAAHRIHHEIAWRYCAPKILSEKHRKGD